MNFFKDYPIEVLKDQTAKAFEKAGSIIKVDEVVPENQLRGYFIMEGEHTNIKVRFTLTPEHEPKIQEFHIDPIVKN
jgi:hypothetical protein